MKEMKDIMALIPTPLLNDGTVDESSLKSLIDYEMENGCYGVGVLAAIGEGYLISYEDWEKVIKISVKHMAGKAPVMVGCPAMGSYHALQLCKKAEELGADAILGFNPTGFRFYSNQELIEHYMMLTESIKIPIAPYARGEDGIPFEVISKLVENKKITYMKYAWKDTNLLKKMAKEFREKYYIFCGADTFTLRYLLLGCKGVLTATAAILPKEHVELLSMVKNDAIEEARNLYYGPIAAWNDIAFSDMNVWQAIHKIAFKEMGIIKTSKVVLPQASPAPHQIDEVMWFLKRFGKI